MPASHAAEVVTLGEAMMLFWPTQNESLDLATCYQRSFAGAESNVCIALARLGHSSRWLSRLGGDAFGRHIRATLEREGVQVDALVDPSAPTGAFFKERVPHGPRRVLYYRHGSAVSCMRPADLTPAHFAGARFFHVTGITPALSSNCAAAVERALELARGAGALISVDPNVRLPLWPTAEICRNTLLPLIAGADLVLVGHEDAAVWNCHVNLVASDKMKASE